MRSRRVVSILTLLALGVSLITAHVEAGTLHWNGQHVEDAINRAEWFDKDNWDERGTPKEDSEVIIDNPGDLKHINFVHGVVKSLKLAAPCILNIDGGDLTITQNFDWSDGGIAGFGTLNIAAGGKMTISGDAAKTLNGVINNEGEATWTSGSVIGPAGFAYFNNRGVFKALGSGSFGPAPDSWTVGVFNNTDTGRFIRSGGGSTRFDNWAFRTSGTVDIEGGGVLALGVRRAEGQHEIRDGAQFTGAGRVRVGCPPDHDTAGLSLVGPVKKGIGIGQGCTLELAEGGWLGGEGRFTGPGTFEWTGGSIAGTLNIAAGGKMTISGEAAKTLGSGGAINNEGKATWINGSVIGKDSATFNNRGVFKAQSSGSFGPPLDGMTVGVFNNTGKFIKSGGGGPTRFDGWAFRTSGTVDIEGGGVLALGVREWEGVHEISDGARFTGKGRVRVGCPPGHPARLGLVGPVKKGIGIAKDCTLELAEGGLLLGEGRFTGPGTFEWTGGGIDGHSLGIGMGTTMQVGGAGEESSAGVVTWTSNASIVNAGEIRLGIRPKTLVINGNYTQHNTGKLNIKIGGRVAGTQYDQLKIRSLASFAGALKVTLIDKLFTPAADDSFSIIAFDTCESKSYFGTYHGPDLGDEQPLVPVYQSQNLTLKVLRLPRKDSISGTMFRVFIAECLGPEQAGYDPEKARLGMEAMLAVVDNRLRHNPGKFLAHGAHDYIDILGAKGQIEGISKGASGIIFDAARQERIDNAIKGVKQGLRGCCLPRYYDHIITAIEVANGPIKDPFENITEIKGIPVTGRGYAWMSGDKSPGANFVAIPPENGGVILNNKFWTLRALYEGTVAGRRVNQTGVPQLGMIRKGEKDATYYTVAKDAKITLGGVDCELDNIKKGYMVKVIKTADDEVIRIEATKNQ